VVNLVPSIQLVPANKKFVFDGNHCAVPETNLRLAELTRRLRSGGMRPPR
jgi:hypothetical protein